MEVMLNEAAFLLYAALFFFCVLTGCGAAFLLTKIIRPRAKTSSGAPAEIQETAEQAPPEDEVIVEEQMTPDDSPPPSREDNIAKQSNYDEVFDYPDFS